MAEQSTIPVKSGNGQIRRRPADAFDAFQEEFMRLWDQAWPFGPARVVRPWRRVASATEARLPDTDIYEKDGAIVVKAELPGVKKEDVQVTMDGGDLVIQGKREAESEVQEQDYYRMERSYGSFYRRIPLAYEPAADQIAATFKDGVLEVRVPKPVETKPSAKQIPVS